MNRLTFPLVLATAAGLAALARPGDEVTFHPEKGSELAKTFETRISLALEDLVVEVNGEEMDPSMMGMPDFDQMTVESTMTMAVEDTYVALGDSRPLELLRDFVKITAEFETGFGDSDSKEDEDLVGSTVRFKWNEEAGEYALSFDGEGGDESKLDKLAEDMDLRALLPRGAVEEGDTWQLGWDEGMSLIMPGFNVADLGDVLASESDEDVPVAAIEALLEQFRSAFSEATATCTYGGTREVDGKRLGVITLVGETSAAIDMLSFIEAAVEESGEGIPDGVDLGQIDLDLSMEFTGELLWDMAAGHFHSLELEGELDGEVSVDVSAAEQGMEFDLSATLEFSGEFGRSVSLGS